MAELLPGITADSCSCLFVDQASEATDGNVSPMVRFYFCCVSNDHDPRKSIWGVVFSF